MTAAQPALHSVLMVEDDLLGAAIIRRHLECNGFRVSHETDGNRAGERVAAEQPDVLLIDGQLPGKDGFDVCREVRLKFSGPILMLTARKRLLDEVVGLEFGADDYITKPADPRLVLARIRAQLRNRQARVV